MQHRMMQDDDTTQMRQNAVTFKKQAKQNSSNNQTAMKVNVRSAILVSPIVSTRKNTAYMTFELEIKLDMWKNREPIVNKQDYNKAEKPSVKTA